jgi:hypothetical protein
MASLDPLIDDRVSDANPEENPSRDHALNANAAHEGHRSGLWRHFGEMLVTMAVGMVVGVAVYLTAIGMTFDEALVRHPITILIVVAISMTVPMVAWMRHRGHGWRSCAEMAAAMIIPVIPFLCLVWFDVTKSAMCGGYCALSVAAMMVLMLYRRSEYSAHVM